MSNKRTGKKSKKVTEPKTAVRSTMPQHSVWPAFRLPECLASPRSNTQPHSPVASVHGGLMDNRSTAPAYQRIQIGNIASGADEVRLRALFLAYGRVIYYERPLDPATGRPGAFVFVEMPSAEAAIAAKALNGHDFNGKSLAVTLQPVAGWSSDADRDTRAKPPRRTVLDSPPPRRPPVPPEP